MNKSCFVQTISQKINLPIDRTTEILNVILSEIETALINGDKVVFPDFGTFKNKKLVAKVITNPKNNVVMNIPERSAPTFMFTPRIRKAISKR